eukprot:7328524-Lingulodinium_polyedra.AAC.1
MLPRGRQRSQPYCRWPGGRGPGSAAGRPRLGTGLRTTAGLARTHRAGQGPSPRARTCSCHPHAPGRGATVCRPTG